MREVQGDPKRFLHVFSNEQLKNLGLSLLAKGHNLFIPKFFLNGMVHLESGSDPAFCRVHYFRRRRTAKVNKVFTKYGLQKRRKTKGLERLGKGRDRAETEEKPRRARPHE